MATISLRQALTPTGNWVILGVHDSTQTIVVNEMLTPTGDWTYVHVHNPGATAANVTYEILAPDGRTLVKPTSVVIQPRATAYLTWEGPKFSSGTMLLRCPQPILPAAYRGQGPERTTLTVHPLLAG